MVNQPTQIEYAGEYMHPIDIVSAVRSVGGSMEEVRGILIAMGIAPEKAYEATYTHEY